MMLFFSALEAGLRADDAGAASMPLKTTGAPIVIRRTRLIRPVALAAPSRIVYQQMAAIVAQLSPPRPLPSSRSRKRNRSRSRSRPRRSPKRQRRRYDQVCVCCLFCF